MAIEPRTLNRTLDIARDKPVRERTEHANLERPGALAHPRARHGGAAAWPVGGRAAWHAGPAWRLG